MPKAEEMKWERTLIQKHLFPAIVELLLRVCVLVRFVDRSQCRDMLNDWEKVRNDANQDM
jgi:hypothetical protein